MSVCSPSPWQWVIVLGTGRVAAAGGAGVSPPLTEADVLAPALRPLPPMAVLPGPAAACPEAADPASLSPSPLSWCSQQL
jgi:hypothetical protein